MTRSLLIYPRPDSLKQCEVCCIIEKIEEFAQKRGWCSFVFPEKPKNADLVISIGGDGTFLEASHLALLYNAPITGINAGSLGFLAEIKIDEIVDIEKIIAGEINLQERIVISVKLFKKHSFSENIAVNEAVAIRNQQSAMMNFHINYDDTEISNYKADGVVVATPTGSTAYNLSLNGPILFPTAHSLIINAMAPHSLTHRPIVLPSNKILEIFFDEKSEGMLTIDGRHSEHILSGDRILIEEDKRVLKFIPSFRRNFFDILSQKLHLGRRD